MSPQIRVEVTDLFDKFHSVAALIWSEPRFRGQILPGMPEIGKPWYEVEDFLEEALFLAGCARRMYLRADCLFQPEEIRRYIQVCDLEGVVRPGEAGQYVSSGFDWGRPEDEEIKNLVIAGGLMGCLLEDVRLFVQIEVPDV